MQVGEAASNGASLAECKALAEKLRDYTDLILTVDTLEFLHRGGRIGGASRWVGTMLQMKPVLEKWATGGKYRLYGRFTSLDVIMSMFSVLVTQASANDTG